MVKRHAVLCHVTRVTQDGSRIVCHDLCYGDPNPNGTIFTATDHEDESLNEEALRQPARFLIAGGVHGLFAVGSQGEFWALDLEEKRRVIEIVVQEAVDDDTTEYENAVVRAGIWYSGHKNWR